MAPPFLILASRLGRLRCQLDCVPEVLKLLYVMPHLKHLINFTHVSSRTSANRFDQTFSYECTFFCCILFSAFNLKRLFIPELMGLMWSLL
jgi:hypothetical protein